MLGPDDGRRNVDTRAVSEALGRALSGSLGVARRVAVLDRRPSWHRTSFAIEEIDVVLDDGTRLEVLLKDLSWGSMPECVRRVKPFFLYDPLREVETYRAILGPHRVGAPACYGASVDPEADRYWLFLERVTDTELHNVAEFAAWLDVARWLARMHGGFTERAGRAGWPERARLLRYDGDFCRLWMRRAWEFRRQPEASAGGDRGRLEWLAARHERAVGRLTALPVTFLHGEFYASNVLVSSTDEGLRVRPVDWEMAAVGPGLLDVAALAAGGWTEDQKEALALAYREALTPAGGWPPGEREFLQAFRCCRLQVAVQWLGWSEIWNPPADFTQDWMGEALRLADELDG